MRTCPSCGRFITDASATACPNCGASLEPSQAASESPQPSAPGYGPPMGAPPYAQPPYGPPPPYGPGYGAPAPYSQPMPSSAYAPPSQPMAPPYGQPPYGSAYGAPPAPPAGQPTYSSGYGSQGGYPGAYRPGVDWKPSAGPTPRPWGRIIGGVVAALAVIAIVAGVIYNLSHTPAHSADSSDIAASTTATALQSYSAGTLLSDSMLTVDSGWPNDSHCYFDTDGYHIHGAFYCAAPIDDRSDGTETVTVKQLNGSTDSMYGLVFRLQDENDFYLFGINASGQWAVLLDVNGGVTKLKSPTTNIAIKGGLNTANTLSVTMSGSTFTFYVNGEKLGAVTDSTFPRGEWGVAAVGNNDLNVVFTNYLAHT